MSVKLKRNEPYAQVYGHSEASFEQDGILFNSQGYPAGRPILQARAEAEEAQQEESAPDSDEVPVAPQVLAAKEFLERLLFNGPLDKATIAGKANELKMNWQDVKDAFELLNGAAYKEVNTEMWRLRNELE